MMRLILFVFGLVALSSCMSLGPDKLTACIESCELHGGPIEIKVNAFTRKVTCGCADGSIQKAATYQGEPL